MLLLLLLLWRHLPIFQWFWGIRPSWRFQVGYWSRLRSTKNRGNGTDFLVMKYNGIGLSQLLPLLRTYFFYNGQSSWSRKVTLWFLLKYGFEIINFSSCARKEKAMSLAIIAFLFEKKVLFATANGAKKAELYSLRFWRSTKIM